MYIYYNNITYNNTIFAYNKISVFNAAAVIRRTVFPVRKGENRKSLIVEEFIQRSTQ